MPLLPAELLINIFLHLHQHDKLNCMLVCHDWKNAMQEFVLYHTLCFYTLPNLEAFTEKIQEQPEIGKRVKRLIINPESRTKDNHIDLTTLLLALPNLDSFFFASRDGVSVTLEEHLHYPCHNRIKYMHIDSQDYELCEPIVSDKCPNLKSLTASLDILSISNLSNLPALTKLELKDTNASFYILEEIHGCAPHLESLLFTSGDFSDVRIKSNDAIVPASAVTTFVLNIHNMRPDNSRTRKNILQYIQEKYPALSSLTFKFASPGGFIDFDVHPSDQGGWVPLLHQLGPQLKTLKMDHEQYIDRPLETFDKAGCQIEYFRIAYFPTTLFKEMMAPSLQFHFIQTLVLEFPFNMRAPGFAWLKNFVVLKKLKFSGPSRNSLKLNKILENCPPFLKVLSFQSTTLTWGDGHLKPYRQLETLSLNETPIQDGFDVFISQHLPGLSKLKLKKCNLLSKRFDVQQMDLASFYFTDKFVNWKNGIMVWTMCNGERRWHIARKDDFRRAGPINHNVDSCGPPYLPVSIHHPSRFRIWPEFTFLCHSVRKVILSE